ncbi:MAG TPA: lipopolysaccharide biosynthesis protein [Chloroflexota bacterium]|nr:lipopolysaccharide biosynthesis protein [Chloroflexota bacterium]HUM67763.1 lipopolysaccharide biosynthesis protein [Chloroflexota bacterium]
MQVPENESTTQRSLTERTLSGFAWMFSGSMAGAGLQLVVTMILARLLSPADFGLLSAALVIIYFSEIFSSLGMGPALVQRKELEPRHINTGFTTNLVLTALLTTLVFFTAPAISTFYRIPELTYVLQVLAFVFPIRGFGVLSEALLKRTSRFRQLATIDFLSYVVGYTFIGIPLAWAGYGVWALVGATLSQAFLRTLLLFVYRPTSLRLRFNWLAFKELIGFGGGFTTTVLVNYLARQGDNFVVGRWLGPEALGFYGKAFSLMTLPTKEFSKIVDDVLFPALAQVQDDRSKLASAYQRGIGTISIVVLPASVFAIILAPELIQLVYGPQWGQAIRPFQILCLSMFFRSAYKMSDTVIKACGAVYRHTLVQVIYATCVIGGAIWAQKWGLVGVAATSASAILIHYVLLGRVSLNLTGLSWRAFLSWHKPALLLSVVETFVLLTIVLFMRYFDVSSFFVLLGGAAGMCASLLLLLRFFPAVFGEAGEWVWRWMVHLLRRRYDRKLIVKGES